MKSLLVIQDHRLRRPLQLQRRNLGQQLWLLARSRVAIRAQSHTRCGRIVCQKIGSQGRGPVRGPGSLVRRMLRCFRCRLRGMMTLNAVDRFGSIYTQVLRDVIDMAKLHRAEFCCLRECVNVLRFLVFLCGNIERRVRYSDD